MSSGIYVPVNTYFKLNLLKTKQNIIYILTIIKRYKMYKSNDQLIEPPLYFGQDHIFDLEFHPKTNILACAMITGQVNM